MPRLLPLVALIVGLVVTAPSAARVGVGKLGFASFNGIYTMNPDGSSLMLLRPAGCLQSDCRSTPRWSPDGSLIAFRDNGQIMVMNATGGDGRTIASPNNIVSFSRQPWSPSSTELTFGDGTSLIAAPVDGGPVRRIVEEAVPVRGAAWSPVGSSIAYVANGLLRVVDVGGGTPITIASDVHSDLNWSPDGRQIAFGRYDGIWVVDADASGLRRIVPSAPGIGDPVWSPDGTKLLFVQSDGGNFPLFDAYVVDVSSRAVTPLTFDRARGETSMQPAWSPDGSWITVQRSTGTQGLGRAMNADGTCARDLPGPMDEVFWQPIPGGPSLARYSCHALRVSAVAAGRSATSVEVSITIENSGTEPLTGVRLRRLTGTDLTPTSVRSTDAECSLRIGPGLCRVGVLLPGQSAEVTVRADGRRTIDDAFEDDWLTTKVSALASEPLTDADAASFEYKDLLGRCTTKTPGGGLIEGTSDSELICGRRGRDRIEPSWGRDRVQAGAGNDVVVLWRDNARDTVSCGPGKDFVYADHRDVVRRDCERVRRTR